MPYYDVAQRAAAIVLKVNGYTNAQITEQTGILLEQLPTSLIRPSSEATMQISPRQSSVC